MKLLFSESLSVPKLSYITVFVFSYVNETIPVFYFVFKLSITGFCVLSLKLKYVEEK